MAYVKKCYPNDYKPETTRAKNLLTEENSLKKDEPVTRLATEEDVNHLKTKDMNLMSVYES